MPRLPGIFDFFARPRQGILDLVGIFTQQSTISGYVTLSGEIYNEKETIEMWGPIRYELPPETVNTRDYFTASGEQNYGALNEFLINYVEQREDDIEQQVRNQVSERVGEIIGAQKGPTRVGFTVTVESNGVTINGRRIRRLIRQEVIGR